MLPRSCGLDSHHRVRGNPTRSIRARQERWLQTCANAWLRGKCRVPLFNGDIVGIYPAIPATIKASDRLEDHGIAITCAQMGIGQEGQQPSAIVGSNRKVEGF